MGNKGYQGAKRGDRVLQGATGCHSGLQRVTGDYKVLQITCFLSRTFPDTFSWPLLHNKTTKGYRRLQGVTGCESKLRDVTGDYRGLQKTCSLPRTSPDTFSWCIFHKGVTRGLQGVPRGNRGFQGVTRDYKG